MTSSSTLPRALPTTFAEAEAILAESLPNYERRPQQGDLARAIEQSISSGTHLIGQGQVGVGKSLAYLIPAILSGKRTVVATATKALQDQLFFKDIPFLQEHLMPFEAALLKGRSNYLCVAALMNADPADVPHLAELLELVTPTADQDLMEFPVNTEFSGERDDLPFEVENKEWMKIAANSDDCSEFKCNDTGNCYAQVARTLAKRANVVVVNHSLYVSDLLIRNWTDGKASMIGDHRIFIADEVHELPEYTSNALGVTFKESGMRFLAAEVRNFGQRYGIPTSDEARALLGAVEVLWSALRPGRVRFSDIEANEDAFLAMAYALKDIEHALRPSVVEAVADQKARVQRRRLLKRAVSASTRFGTLMTAPFTEIVRWVEMEKDRPVLKMAPIDVAPFLSENIFDPEVGVTAIMVSGTVAVSGSMSYMATTLGVDTYDQIIVDSPFDFESQARFYIPDLPDPKQESGKWSAMAANEMLQLVRATEGRALILFTSISEMNNAYEMISGLVPYTCLKQGQKSNKELVSIFKSDTSSVLFGTKSFMTGIDIQGEALTLLILNKLTFPVPSEPMFEAKSELVESRGGNSFFDLSVPMMTLTLQQAFGRLIRSQSDKGVAVLLDPRVKTKNYGSGILRSLPPMPQVSSIEEIKSWL